MNLFEQKDKQMSLILLDAQLKLNKRQKCLLQGKKAEMTMMSWVSESKKMFKEKRLRSVTDSNRMKNRITQ